MRTFVAIEIDSEDIIRRIKSMQESVSFKAKPVKIDQIHFTLQFLGEIDEETCKKIKKLFCTIAFSQFNLSLKGIGVFPNLKNPRIVWIGTDKKGVENLMEISKQIEMKLASLGFKKDKKFRAHLTIFRIKERIDDISNEIKKYEKMEFGAQVISKIKFKKSVLSPEGPIYSDLLEVKGNEK